ncbi:MAG: transcription antitermination factor NusB [Planctomycetota bacterium]|nr:transcription antitermination factor NusB [Planctomycetota bacterium]
MKRIRRRTAARRLALQLLYEEIIRKKLDEERISSFLRRFAPLPPVRNYAKTLIQGVLAYKKELDSLLSCFSFHWDYRRVSPVERSILRLAAYEILYEDVPIKSAIEEAVELAKLYATKEASSFVNGILHSFSISLLRRRLFFALTSLYQKRSLHSQNRQEFTQTE